MAKRKLPKNVRERNGKYYYRYDIINPVTGKRKQKETEGFATPREAEREGIRIEAEKLNGSYIEDSKISFSDFADRWLKLYRVRKVKENTVDQRESTILIAKQKFGGLALSKISLTIYQDTLHDLKEEEYSISAIRSFHVVMRMIFRKSAELDLIKKDVTEHAELPEFVQTVEELENGTEIPEHMEKEELAKLLKTAKEHADGQIYRILYVLAHTGLRVGELTALRVSDFNEVNRTLSITKSIYIPETVTKYVLNTPKTKSSVRVVDISQKVASVINEQIAWRKEMRMLHRKRFYEKEAFLFFNAIQKPGYPLVPSFIRQRMRDVLSMADLPTTFTTHSLRHTYTSLMAEAGASLEEIQKLLGHKNDRTTRDVYHHVTKTRKAINVERLDNLMSGLL